MKNLKTLVKALLVLVLLFSEGVYARMYQWIEADTGSTQLSGKPPMWYRSASSGPRVFVFDNGRLIDDTGIEVDDEVRQQLRQRAFVLVEEDKQNAKDKLTKSLELKRKFVKDKPKKAELEDFEDPPQQIPTDEELIVDESSFDEQEEDASTENTVDELRQLVIDWDNAKTENAKKALGQ